MYRRRTGAHPVRHPADWSVVRSPCSRGPHLRASCAQWCRSQLSDPASSQVMDGRQRSGKCAVAWRRGAQPIARARRACSSTRMCGFAPARDRRAPRV